MWRHLIRPCPKTLLSRKGPSYHLQVYTARSGSLTGRNAEQVGFVPAGTLIPDHAMMVVPLTMGEVLAIVRRSHAPDRMPPGLIVLHTLNRQLSTTSRSGRGARGSTWFRCPNLRCQQ